MPLVTASNGLTTDTLDQGLLVKAPATSAYFLNSAASTNAVSVKASVAVITDAVMSNSGAAAAFVKIYNKATAPIVGTDVPVATLVVPALGHAALDVNGLALSAGLAIAVTNLAPDADATAVAAGQVKLWMQYK